MTDKPAKFSDIEDAFSMVDVNGLGEIEAWVDRRTGVTYVSIPEAISGEKNVLPDDIDDEDRYLSIPDKRDLGLGKPLVMRFARNQVPELYDRIWEIFSRRGAYARFKGLLEREGHLEEWYAYEEEQRQQAIRQWCDDNGIALSD